ncbi:glycogen debranching enzyme, partial [Thermodesulfobacteriota bacterium]
INYVTCHDGFTLQDLVSYNKKYNRRNGERNRDGTDHNISWNSGAEGVTDKPKVIELRARRVKTLTTILFFSQGVPMILAGDEFGRTQGGNNNAYCQDNPVGWVDWSLAEKNRGLLRFFQLIIALRRKHPALRRAVFFPAGEKGDQVIKWQSLHPGRTDWSASCRTLAFFLNGDSTTGEKDDDFFVMLNSHLRRRSFTVPKHDNGLVWEKIIDTGEESPHDIHREEAAVPLKNLKVLVEGMGAVVLIARRKK